MTIWEIAPKNWVDQKALIHLSIIDITRDIAPTNTPLEGEMFMTLSLVTKKGGEISVEDEYSGMIRWRTDEGETRRLLR